MHRDKKYNAIKKTKLIKTKPFGNVIYTFINPCLEQTDEYAGLLRRLTKVKRYVLHEFESTIYWEGTPKN